jgi:bifunctional non-homologous end joining protein LigD
LKTRNGLDWTHRFGAIPAALQRLGLESAVLDGEMTALGEGSLASFARLQAALSGARRDAFVYVLFDLIYADGYDLRALPQQSRRQILERVFAASSDASLTLSVQFEASPDRVFSEVCRLGMEGVVSKMLDSRYVSGRSGTWVKSKCSLSDDVVVVGYLPSTANTRAIGALAVARLSDDGTLAYAGRVGTGYSERTARDLWSRLQALRTRPGECFFSSNPDRGVTWVRPSLVAEVSFTGWTRDGLLRHAVFKRLRDDKNVPPQDRGARRVSPRSAP